MHRPTNTHTHTHTHTHARARAPTDTDKRALPQVLDGRWRLLVSIGLEACPAGRCVVRGTGLTHLCVARGGMVGARYYTALYAVSGWPSYPRPARAGEE
eukprot:56571-Eustigmatos_ZCMA.PRE.1